MKTEPTHMHIVAYQGIEGAYSHLACKRFFPNYQTQACENFQTAIQLVENGEASYAMIPLENSTAGRVEEIYRLLPNTHLHIIGEHFEPVNHCLLALPGTTLDQIKTVSSHPQALAQCFHRLDDLNITPLVAMDTALSAKDLSSKKEAISVYGSHGAIASTLAAELYGLDILSENFQDRLGNTTRFIILAKNALAQPYDPSQHYITSILFSVRNIPSALYKALGGFATNGINLIKLESYMDGGTMSASHFHIDIAGHHQQTAVKNALEELRFFGKELRILGAYPAHTFRKKNEYV